MKKSLVALAALAVVGTASAQSSVTMFGVLDAGISSWSNKSEDKNVYDWNAVIANPGNPFYMNRGSVTQSWTGMTNSGYNSSRLGFRGTEDLGGGLAASFWLEAALGNDTGAAGGSGAAINSGLFNRRSTVSLSGNFGEVRLGRDYTPTFWNDTVFDPFGTNGVGTNLPYKAASGAIGQDGWKNDQYVRANNSVGYFLPPNLGGFYGQVMYAFHENAKYSPGDATPAANNNSRTGRYAGGRFGYANGPVDVALAYGSTTIGDKFYAGDTTNMNTWNLGASYDLGPVKLFAEYNDTKVKTDSTGLGLVATTQNFMDIRGISNPSVKGWLIGATVPVGPGLIRMSYGSAKYNNDTQLTLREAIDPYRCLNSTAAGCGNDPKANQFAIGYVHNLSKRTALYATVARVSNKDGAGLATSTAGLGSGYAAKSPDVNIPGFGNVPGVGLTPKTSTGYDFGIRHSF
ncbi:MAG: porin [Variovorax sp.]|nr:porin [Variovorax sp.]